MTYSMRFIGIGRMSTEEFKQDIEDWITGWVSVHNDQLGHIPCPFARKALADKKIEWILCEDKESIEITLYGIMEMGLPNEVVVVGVDPIHLSSDELRLITKKANEKWLMPSGLVALEDHPYDTETKNGVIMNQGKWALVLIQETAKLNDASLKLRAQGYYDKWTEEELNDVVNWRFN